MAIDFNPEQAKTEAAAWEANKAKKKSTGPRKWNQLNADRWYKFKVVAAKNRTAGTGTEQISLRLAPLDSNDQEVTNVSMFHTLNLPFRNPDVVNHKAPNTFNWCNRFLNAIYPETHPLRYGADDIVRGKEALAKYHANPEALVGEVFFGYVKDSEWNGKVKREVSETVPLPPDGEDVEYTDFIDPDFKA